MLSLQLYFKATDPFSERWQSAWIITAFWDILAFALLCVICYLWAPSQSSQRCSAVSIFLLMMKIFLKEKNIKENLFLSVFLKSKFICFSFLKKCLFIKLLMVKLII
jgi:hypothetical protein